MANEEHLKILLQRVEVWNQWRESNPEIKPDFSYADLRRANPGRANLSETDFCGRDFPGKDLSSINLGRVNLRYVNLRYANLRYTDISGVIFNGANFRETDLSGRDVTKTDLSGVDFQNANLQTARFINLNPRMRTWKRRFKPLFTQFLKNITLTHWVKSSHLESARHYWLKLHFSNPYRGFKK
jgi:uncharacterized protein YjbI with pentapeptide repeats